ncbi:MAG TPA: cytochrome o ubiquinol oxidase subunit IV [Caulobacteraceae bacterium]
MTETVISTPTHLRTPGTDTRGSTGRWPTYAVGFAIAAGLTAASFVLAANHWLTPASLVAALVVLAIAQMIVHLIFFLHITTAPAQKTNILALLLTLLIISLVVIGSLWIMAQLNAHMVPMDQLMQMQR